jgi:hypothetical protein
VPAEHLLKRCDVHLDAAVSVFGGVATLIALDKLTNRIGWFGLVAAIGLAVTVGWIGGNMRRRPVVHAVCAMLGWIAMSTLGGTRASTYDSQRSSLVYNAIIAGVITALVPGTLVYVGSRWARRRGALD